MKTTFNIDLSMIVLAAFVFVQNKPFMKRIIFLFVTLPLMLHAGAQTPQQSDGKPKTKKEVEAELTNFSISLVFDAQGQKPYHFYQARCEQGWAFRMEGEWGNQSILVDESAGKAYKLNDREKTGVILPYDPKFAYRGIEQMLAAHIFLHASFLDDSGFKKTGSEKIAGRDATVYTYTYGDGLGTFWIDNKYGFTLKYIQTGTHTIHTEVTGFKAGGVTLADMVKLSEYRIAEPQ